MAGRVAFAFLLQPIVFMMFFVVLITFAQDQNQFIYNGFQGAHLRLDGLAEIYPSGLLQMTNTSKQQSGHAFYPQPFKFNATPSFSTAFVFAMNPDVPNHGGHGISFVISPSLNFKQAVPAEYLGIFNLSNNGLQSNHIFAVELDTVQNAVFGDIDGNHVGVDVNGLRSIDSASAAYYHDKEGVEKRSLDLTSKKPMQVWIDYNGDEMIVNVTLAPLTEPKPSKSLVSTRFNLSAIFLDSMYIGFSSSTGLTANEHYILGWSWSQSGQAQALDPSKLPPLPRFRNHKGTLKPIVVVFLVILLLLLVMIAGGAYLIRRRMYEEFREDWEQEYASYRLSYKDLYVGTKGFKDSELLGSGGFGKVYKGVLPTIQTQVAVKRISHDSRQGMREFVAEIVSMGRLRHRNLVQLLGYCRRKGELLLVYDFMPNGSLDGVLFRNSGSSILSWSQRFAIIKGVASALVYLHEEWEQVVLHRDVKASNVLLDAEMNARLGDFGLARLYDHGSNPQSTHVVGTVGYLAPELSRTGKPTTATDVFAFGVFLFEVACGRRPIGLIDSASEDFVLGDWVFHCWKKGEILETSDPKLEGNYDIKDMELVLKLGLLCSHPQPESRPKMRHVVQFLRGNATLPDIPTDYDHHEWDGFLGEGWPTSGSFPSSSSGVSFGTFPSCTSAVHQSR